MFKVGDKVRYGVTGNDFIPLGSIGIIESTIEDVKYTMVRFDHAIGRWTVPMSELEYAENGIQRAIKCLK